jgi:hypothetical protein
MLDMTPLQPDITTGLKVAGGGTVTGWLAVNEPILAWVVGVLTAALLVQTIWHKWRKGR